jgi:hypothetical protein
MDDVYSVFTVIVTTSSLARRAGLVVGEVAPAEAFPIASAGSATRGANFVRAGGSLCFRRLLAKH